MKRLALMALLCGTTALFAQTFKFADDRTVDILAAEGQSTVVAPGHPKCVGGRILVSTDVGPGKSGAIAYRDLDGTQTKLSAIDPLPATQAEFYSFLTSDHDLVSMANGDVYYLTAAGSRAPITPEPAWFKSAYRTQFGPGTRGVLLVWRSTDCGETFQYMPNMEVDSATFADGSCAMPQAQLTHRHHEGDQHYLVAGKGFPQKGDWFAYCERCHQLFRNVRNERGFCPLGGVHTVDGNPYKVTTIPLGTLPGRGDFKVCTKCKTLFHAAARRNACAVQSHDSEGSAQYFVPVGNPPAGQGRPPRWRSCSKCQTIFDANISSSNCPLGASHDFTAGDHYDVKMLQHSLGTPAKQWTKCSKCGGLFKRNASGNFCAMTKGKHVDSGDDLQVLTALPAGGGVQEGWRRCNRCGLLFNGLNKTSSQCPLVRTHTEAKASATYQLALDDGTSPPVNLQTDWRTCKKCGSVYFKGTVGGGCVIASEGDTPIFDMGGTDGQLVTAETALDRLYLTFRCVGRVPSTVPGDFDLTAVPLGKSIVAVSEKGQPWTLMGMPQFNVWRMGIVALDASTVAIGGGLSNAFLRANSSTTGKWTFPTTFSFVGGYAEPDWTNPPYSLVNANFRDHAILARTPGTSRGMMILPDIIPNLGFGYRIFFEGEQPDSFSEATTPITPATNSSADVVFHLQAVSSGSGNPVLLYWYDFDSVAKTITIRGRVVAGDGKYSKDFALSRAGNKARSFPAQFPAMGYGDYQTAGGYVRSDQVYVFHPMWVESGDNKAHFGTVIYDPSALTTDVMLKTVKPAIVMKRVALSELKLSARALEAQEAHERKQK